MVRIHPKNDTKKINKTGERSKKIREKQGRQTMKLNEVRNKRNSRKEGKTINELIQMSRNRKEQRKWTETLLQPTP